MSFWHIAHDLQSRNTCLLSFQAKLIEMEARLHMKEAGQAEEGTTNAAKLNRSAPRTPADGDLVGRWYVNLLLTQTAVDAHLWQRCSAALIALHILLDIILDNVCMLACLSSNHSCAKIHDLFDTLLHVQSKASTSCMCCADFNHTLCDCFAGLEALIMALGTCHRNSSSGMI